MEALKEQYVKEVVPAMMKKFNYTSVMQVPKLEKIVINNLSYDTFQKDTKENTMENSDRVKKLSVEKNDTIQNQSEIISPEILNEEKETYESEKKSKSILEKFFSLVKEFFPRVVK